VIHRAEVASTVRELLLTSWPHRFAPDQLEDHVSLGEEGLGLDSVEVAEFILACEERLGAADTEELFELLPLTIERVVEHFAFADA